MRTDRSVVVLTAADFRRMVDVNLTGVFLMVKTTAPLLRAAAGAESSSSARPRPLKELADQVPYVARKPAFSAWRSLARVLGKDGVTVNVVTPGLTLTPHIKQAMPAEMIGQQVKLRAISRDERAEDLVGAVFFLASPDADLMSGQTVNVDGGKHML